MDEQRDQSDEIKNHKGKILLSFLLYVIFSYIMVNYLSKYIQQGNTFGMLAMIVAIIAFYGMAILAMKKFSDGSLDGLVSVLFGFFILAIVFGEFFKSLLISFGVFMIIRGLRVFEIKFTESGVDERYGLIFSFFRKLLSVPRNKCDKDEHAKN